MDRKRTGMPRRWTTGCAGDPMALIEANSDRQSFNSQSSERSRATKSGAFLIYVTNSWTRDMLATVSSATPSAAATNSNPDMSFGEGCASGAGHVLYIYEAPAASGMRDRWRLSAEAKWLHKAVRWCKADGQQRLHFSPVTVALGCTAATICLVWRSRTAL